MVIALQNSATLEIPNLKRDFSFYGVKVNFLLYEIYLLFTILLLHQYFYYFAFRLEKRVVYFCYTLLGTYMFYVFKYFLIHSLEEQKNHY